MDVWKRDIWTNPGVNSIFGQEIYEYDIASAGANLLKFYHLVDDSISDKLLSLPKKKRVVEMGLYLKKHPDLNKSLKEAFANIRKMFFESNGIDMYDLVSIKKDAIFLTREVKFTIFDNIEFRVKNKYTSFIQLSPLELYYANGEVTIKGINETEIPYFSETWIPFYKTLFQKAEGFGKDEALQYLRRFIDRYKKDELPIEYYREFRPGAMFSVLNPDDTNAYFTFPEERRSELNIQYNYLNVLMKTALIFV